MIKNEINNHIRQALLLCDTEYKSKFSSHFNKQDQFVITLKEINNYSEYKLSNIIDYVKDRGLETDPFLSAKEGRFCFTFKISDLNLADKLSNESYSLHHTFNYEDKILSINICEDEISTEKIDFVLSLLELGPSEKSNINIVSNRTSTFGIWINIPFSLFENSETTTSNSVEWLYSTDGATWVSVGAPSADGWAVQLTEGKVTKVVIPNEARVIMSSFFN